MMRRFAYDMIKAVYMNERIILICFLKSGI